MTPAKRVALLAVLMVAPGLPFPTEVYSAEPSATLATPQSFDGIGDTAVHGSREGADFAALRELPPGRRSPPPGSNTQAASAPGRARSRRLRHSVDALRQLPPKRQFRSRGRARPPALASGAERDGLAGQDAGRDPVGPYSRF
jgi:hypothetical protein